MPDKNADIQVRCVKCGDIHMEADRPKRSEEELAERNCTPTVCPKCGHTIWESA